MGRSIGTICAVAALVSLAAGGTCTLLPADAARGGGGAKRSTRMVSGDQGLQNLNRLLAEVPWYTSLEFAQKKAQRENKPVFWVHMLGPMNGAT